MYKSPDEDYKNSMPDVLRTLSKEELEKAKPYLTQEDILEALRKGKEEADLCRKMYSTRPSAYF